jgi:hypothetical protein
METRNEVTAIHAFAVGLDPMSTQLLEKSDVGIHSREKETHIVEVGRQADPFMRTDINAEGVSQSKQTGTVTTVNMEEQEREKQLLYDMKTVNYTPWTKVRSWVDTV